jgi:murein DD-endopeptidase MepM/ murein hydrolase activator NlpD
MMARPIEDPSRSRRRRAAGLATAAALVVIALVYVSGMLAGGASPTATPGSAVAGLGSSFGASPSHATSPTARATNSAGAGGGPLPTPDGSGTPDGEPDPSPEATPTATPPVPTPNPTPRTTSRPPGAAPDSPADFDLHGQAIAMAFPLLPDAHYRYRDNFLDRRDGPPDPYNHERVEADGKIQRLHDGIDIYGQEGEPLVAPFSGNVIDPRDRWPPWESDRYGNTVAIVSDDPLTAGYTAILVHLDRKFVKPGDHVTQGQVVGTLGRTGNAEMQSIHAHLHFELRAPFLLDWTSLGEDRTVDAFNPYPSLVAADPKRN